MREVFGSAGSPGAQRGKEFGAVEGGEQLSVGLVPARPGDSRGRPAEQEALQAGTAGEGGGEPVAAGATLNL
ncbi:hypothetical protein [Streptomyces sp. NPDC048737]|uniref:hypothetical protein n=1 Tax=unclassified Streptomyces TaxID=2593676 RepID=UPI0034304B0B